MFNKPSQLGFNDCNFELPKLNIISHIVKSENNNKDTLFIMPAEGLNETRVARKESIKDRLEEVKKIISKNPNEQYLIWCDYNSESELLHKELKESVEVKGSDSNEHKEKAMMDFSNSKIKILISKQSICGFGMNWQQCNNMIFFGLSYSYEGYYQAIRRCWRFGQKKDVNVEIVLSEKETSVLENITKKQKQHQKMSENIINNTKQYFSNSVFKNNYMENKVETKNYTAILGDSIEKIKELKDNSIDYQIFSPPFSSLYTYSNSERDMGNCKNDDEFYKHYEYLIKEQYRILKPGRLLSFHCMLLPTSKYRDGVIGLKDFRGDLIRLYQNAGFIYHSEVVIWKDPVVAMQRTKALGLLYKQLKKDSAMSRQGVPDYLITMRKLGDNKEPITKKPENFSVDMWQKFASPVWTDINQSNTLQKKSAREEKDEKHICPLQLDVIERALYLWTNPNDTVFSPFMGIGSEGYSALKLRRKFIGIELKKSYYEQAVKNLKISDNLKKQETLL